MAVEDHGRAALVEGQCHWPGWFAILGRERPGLGILPVTIEAKHSRLVGQGDQEAATQHLLRSKELGEHAALPDLHYRSCIAVARIKVAQGDLDGALRAYTDAQVVAPDAPELHYNIGSVLYRKGDFMHQATKDMCVAGSTQTMMNIIDPGKPNRSIAFQKRLYERGRRLSPNQAKLGPIGVDLSGWAELLNRGGYGPYIVESADTRRGAIRKAAKAIRETNKPVGLVTWRGAHSWVMSGFTANADPAYDNGFKVEAAYIQDTWYPYVSTIWGASTPPNTLVPVGKLAEDYLPYNRPRANYPKRDGKFMLILPVLPSNTVAR